MSRHQVIDLLDDSDEDNDADDKSEEEPNENKTNNDNASISSGWSEDSVFAFVKNVCVEEELSCMGAVGTANQFSKGVMQDLLEIGIESVHDRLTNVAHINQLLHQADEEPTPHDILNAFVRRAMQYLSVNNI